MRWSAIVVLLVATCSIGSMSGDQACAKCDCTHWPWKDECNKCCTLKVLQTAQPDDLKTILNLDDKSIGKIVTKRTKDQLNSLRDLNEILSESQLRSIDQRLSKLTFKERDRLKKDIAPKKELNYLEQRSEGRDSPNIATGDKAVIVTQGPGSIAQVGGTGNTATVNNVTSLPDRRILPGDRSPLIAILQHNSAKVSVSAPEGDNEAQQLGMDLYATLKGAGWQMKDPIVMSFFQVGGPIEPGITVYRHGEPVKSDTAVTLPDNDPLLLLKQLFIKANLQWGNQLRMGTSEGVIDIEIGPRPKK